METKRTKDRRVGAAGWHNGCVFAFGFVPDPGHPGIKSCIGVPVGNMLFPLPMSLPLYHD